MSEKIRINSLAELSTLQAAIRKKGFPCNVTITGACRSLPQNALFHKWCECAAQFFVSMGKTTFATGAPMNMENMKRNLKLTSWAKRLSATSTSRPAKSPSATNSSTPAIWTKAPCTRS